MLVERKMAKRTKMSVAKKMTRSSRIARADRIKQTPIVMNKADNSAVTMAIARVGAKYEKMLNLLSQ